MGAQNLPKATRHLILGTAGHIDHGKTSLVKALTGVDTDRLPEEKRRGMTIELGFAELRIGELSFGIVDVPGHERFVRTMVAGATGIDLALLVVAADDSVMPQTIEHVEILELLGIRHGVVALTKCDLVDAETVELVAEDVRDLLAPTALKNLPVVPCSAVSGSGLDELRRRLREAAGQVAERREAPFRLPIDRVFTVAGRGTVATGSVLSGCLRAGDSVDVLPAGLRARVREVQSHGADADEVAAGQRAAVNLQGVSKDDVARGCELAAADSIKPTRLLDVRLSCLRSHPRPLDNHARVRLSIGTCEVFARCVMLHGQPLAPGAAGYAQLRCVAPVAAAFGQHFILRDENAARTAGGGVVLRCASRRISARMPDEVAGLATLAEGPPAARVAEVLRVSRFDAPARMRIALAAGVSVGDVGALLDELVAAGELVVAAGADRLLSAAFLEAFERRACTWLRTFHSQHPDEPGCLAETFLGWLERKSDKAMARWLLERLQQGGAVRTLGRYACLPEFAPALSAQDERCLALMLDALQKAAFQPPSPGDLARLTGANASRVQKLLKVAASMGDVVRIDADLFLHADCERAMRAKARALFAADGPFTVSALRQALDSSRKYVVPLAEYLDRIGFTRRNGDTRAVIAPEEP